MLSTEDLAVTTMDTATVSVGNLCRGDLIVRSYILS